MSLGMESQRGAVEGNTSARSSKGVWLRERARVLPGALTEAAPWVRGRFEHAWAPVVRLGQAADCLPDELFAFLLSVPRGYVAILSSESRYCPGPALLRGHAVENVAYVSLEDLAQDRIDVLQAIGHLIDHHLGCAGEEEGLWLSGGGGVSPGWRTAGERLAGLFALGYGIDEVARTSLRGYFARSVAWYCRDRAALNVEDPQIERWLRNSIWDEIFWRTNKRFEGE